MTASHTANPRCPWCGDDPLYVAYHDGEWGVPVRDDRTLFEFLVLEGAQAGLSWLTVLRKRAGYRKAFADFDAAQVARFSDDALERLLEDPAIVRNRLKVFGARRNAQAFLTVQQQFGSFSEYIWGFVNGQPIQNRWRTMSEVPAVTPLAEQISKDMKQRGFTFVGPTILYAHMQATGMVNDHLVHCPRHAECAALA
jgi:DNA-3-methyladenine glycosylase I